MKTDQTEAIALCRILELVAPSYGAHVALTGGCLYKDGPRKDIDIIVYRIRQTKKIDLDGFFYAIGLLGVEKVSGFGWCHKAVWESRNVDLLFPEEVGGKYPIDEPQFDDSLPDPSSQPPPL